ncbi:MAG: hypothetical protein AAF654_07965 [Myxococcota bacterium]
MTIIHGPTSKRLPRTSETSEEGELVTEQPTHFHFAPPLPPSSSNRPVRAEYALEEPVRVAELGGTTLPDESSGELIADSAVARPNPVTPLEWQQSALEDMLTAVAVHIRTADPDVFSRRSKVEERILEHAATYFTPERAGEVIEGFARELDPERLVLTGPDVRGWQDRFSQSLSEEVPQGGLETVFAIYNEFRQIRAQAGPTIANQISQLDLEGNDFFIAHQRLTWAISDTQLEDRRRRHFTNSVIEDTIEGVPDATSRLAAQHRDLAGLPEFGRDDVASTHGFDRFMDAFLGALDRQSTYIAPSYRPQYVAEYEGRVTGIGAEVGQVYARDLDGEYQRFIRIKGLRPMSPAHGTGLAEGDIILGVSNEDTRASFTPAQQPSYRGARRAYPRSRRNDCSPSSAFGA